MSPSDTDRAAPDDRAPDDRAPEDPAPEDPGIDIGDAIPLDVCPGCDGRDFLVESHPEVVFRCLGCAAAWRVHLGFVWAADAPAPDAVLPEGAQGP